MLFRSGACGARGGVWSARGRVEREGACPTCDDLPELGVQVDGAGQEHLHVAGRQDGCPGGQEDLETPDVSVDLQQGLHVLGGRDVLGDPAGHSGGNGRGAV